jgi:hypothetical protein
MPFDLVKYKRGWRVKDTEGNYYSKKALSKKRATAQLRALYATYKGGDLFIGSGYAIHKGELITGEGFFSDAFTFIKDRAVKAYNAIRNVKVAPLVQTVADLTTSAVRKDYPPDSLATIQKYGDGTIQSILIRREPIKSYVNTLLNFISFGKWNQLRGKLNKDKLFHLSMIVSVKMPSGQTGNIMVEKNERIKITDNFNMRGASMEYINIPVPCCITFDELLQRAEEQMGGDYFIYDAFKANCSLFLKGILDASNLSTPESDAFILQYIDELIAGLPSYISPTARTITNVAAVANQIISGGDIDAPTDTDVADFLRYAGLPQYSGAGKEEQIDFEDMKWGSFTEQFNAFKRQHPKTSLRDLKDFAEYVLRNPRGFKERTKKRAQFYTNVILKGGAEPIADLNPDGSWKGDMDSWSNAGFPGCGPNSFYVWEGDCNTNCYENDEPFACRADKGDRKQKEADADRWKDKAQIRTTNQDGDALKRSLYENQLRQDEEGAKGVATASEIPPVPEWNDIPAAEGAGPPTSTYTGFLKWGNYNPTTDPQGLGYNIAYYKNGKALADRLKAGATIQYNFDIKKLEDRWLRLQGDSDPTNPTRFVLDGVEYDDRGRVKFNTNKHLSLDFLNSVEGRHIREADPYFEEYYKKRMEQEHAYNKRTPEQAQQYEAELERKHAEEERKRYGDNEEIYSPESGYTLTDKRLNKRRINKVRLRQDGGYDIQFDNGTWEYQPGVDEWDCNEYSKGDNFRNVGVCGTEGRKRAAGQVEQDVRQSRDREWDGLSGWDKFVNGLNVAGAVTQDYVLPIASTVLSFVPGAGLASTALDVAQQISGALVPEGTCRHFNECTDQAAETAKAQSLYHKTKGDRVATQYFTDANWAKLLENNDKVIPLLQDTYQYGSRAGKFAATGSGKPTSRFVDQIREAGYTPEQYLRQVRKYAKARGYDSRAIQFSDRPDKKFMIWDDDGKPRYFGQVGYGDFHLWSKKDKAEGLKKQKAYLARATKIKGDWKSDKFSPNSLAIAILW